jgi:hypothetical protein
MHSRILIAQSRQVLHGGPEQFAKELIMSTKLADALHVDLCVVKVKSRNVFEPDTKAVSWNKYIQQTIFDKVRDWAIRIYREMNANQLYCPKIEPIPHGIRMTWYDSGRSLQIEIHEEEPRFWYSLGVEGVQGQQTALRDQGSVIETLSGLARYVSVTGK